MSGPKDYAPPPMYSINVFDGKLNDIFRLQCQLQELEKELAETSIDDNERQIHISCTDALKKEQKNRDALLKPIVFDYKGKFGQEVYESIMKQTNSIVSHLESHIAKLEKMRSSMKAKTDAYNAYVNFSLYRINALTSFDVYRDNLVQYLNEEGQKSGNSAITEAARQISLLRVNLPEPVFDEAYHKKAEKQTQELIAAIATQEKAISDARRELAREIQKAGKQDEVNILDTPPDAPEEKLRLVSQIEKLFERVSLSEVRNTFRRELEALQQSPALTHTFYLKQLHDKVLENIQEHEMKSVLASLILQINAESFHTDLTEKRQKLVSRINAQLHADSPCKTTLTQLQKETAALIEASNAHDEADEIKNKERLFLKTQIIHSLEKMGYEVMDDLEVIDFEKNDDFLLKINGQSNYLNLKFKEDGSFRYVFQIPEEVEALSTDSRNMKLHEMEVSCDDFRSVLAELGAMGLKVNLRSAKPVAVSSLITVPEHKKHMISSKKKQEHKHNTIKKRYLG